MRFEQLGPYHIGKKLGQGGMGSVYEAIETMTNRPVAVKVLSPAMASERGFRARFEAEIESLKKLHHPNIVRLYGYGEQEEYLFYGMELVKGRSLDDAIRAGRRFQWREVIEMAIPLCKALKHAHDSGVIHRDIKPANLLLTPEGGIKITDFGIARLFGNQQLTAEGGVIGTAEYMAPEQAEGGLVSDRADQYSLGGVLYTLAAGRPPFKAKSVVEMLQLQRYAEPDPVRRHAPEVPIQLEQILMKLLAKDPSERFPNAGILARTFENLLQTLSVDPSQSAAFDLNQPQTSPGGTNFDPFAATMSPEQLAAQSKSKSAQGSRAAATAVGKSAQDAPTKVGLSSMGRTSTRFTTVEDGSARAARPPQKAIRHLISAQTVSLMLGILAILLLLVYFLRPESADQRFAHFLTTAAQEDGERAMLLEADNLAAFLAKFPDDPRAEKVRSWQHQNELTQADIDFRQLAKGRRLGTEAKLPLEKQYVEALVLAEQHDWEQAVARLLLIIQMNPHPETLDPASRKVTELAARKEQALSLQIQRQTEADLSMIRSRLAKAQQLRETDLPAAKTLWRVIVQAYRPHPWAADLVAAAEQALQENP